MPRAVNMMDVVPVMMAVSGIRSGAVSGIWTGAAVLASFRWSSTTPRSTAKPPSDVRAPTAVSSRCS
jgi:hypothetical protein